MKPIERVFAAGANTVAFEHRRNELAMRLPEGKTCSDCVHVRRCVDALGCTKPERTSCDFYPNRFVASKEQNA